MKNPTIVSELLLLFAALEDKTIYYSIRIPQIRASTCKFVQVDLYVPIKGRLHKITPTVLKAFGRTNITEDSAFLVEFIANAGPRLIDSVVRSLHGRDLDKIGFNIQRI